MDKITFAESSSFDITLLAIFLAFLVQSSWGFWFNLLGILSWIFWGFWYNLLGVLLQSSWVSLFNLPGFPGSIFLGLLVQSSRGLLFNLPGVYCSIFLGFVNQSENSPLEHDSLRSILAFKPVYFQFIIIVPLVLYFSFSDFRMNLEFIIILKSKFYCWFQVRIPADADLRNKKYSYPTSRCTWTLLPSML